MSKSTVLRGGEVFGDVTEVVASHEAGLRLLRSEARVVNRGTEVELVPELTRAGAAAADYTRLPEVTDCEAEFGNVFGSVLSRREYFSTRKVVERQRPDGTRLLSVAPRLPDFEDVSYGTPTDTKVRKYSLVQFFTDSYLREKYDLGRKIYESLREQALGDADGAAARLQKLVRSMPGCEQFSVGAGQYSRSRKWAKDSVRRASASANPIENIMDCRIFGDKISIYGPGPETDLRWSVTAPVWETAVALQVHKIVQTSGTAPTMFALGAELTVLAVDIHNGHSYECPTVQRHVGVQDGMAAESSPMTMSVLSAVARIRLSELAKHIAAVTVDGDQVASAVGIGKLGVLINSHIIDSAGDAGACIAGEVVRPDKQVSRDLWVAKAAVPNEQAWTMRAAIPGEQVFIYHSVGGVVVASPLVTLRSADGVTLTMSVSNAMRPGMSGGAIVALKDMALLGVYEGAGATQAVGLAFTAEHFTDLCTYDDGSVTSQTNVGLLSDGWYSKFQKRGLGKVVDSVIEALVPLSTVSGEHVGCALSVGETVYTTVAVDNIAVRAGASATPLQFEPSGAPGLFAAAGAGVVTGAAPQLVRKPVLSERVLFMARDVGGPYYTVRPATVVHVAFAGKSFVVGLPEQEEDMLPLTGSAVVAVSDGAVLGVYAARTVTMGFGAGVACISVDRAVTSEVELPPSVVLSKIFPMLRPEAWPDGVAAAVLTLSEQQAQAEPDGAGVVFAYSFLGEAALRVVLGDLMLHRGYSRSVREEKAVSLQSPAVVAAAAERLGLAAEIRAVSGRVLSLGAVEHCEVLRAVAGAVFKFEPYAVLQQFAGFCGLLMV